MSRRLRRSWNKRALTIPTSGDRYTGTRVPAVAGLFLERGRARAGANAAPSDSGACQALTTSGLCATPYGNPHRLGQRPSWVSDRSETSIPQPVDCGTGNAALTVWCRAPRSAPPAPPVDPKLTVTSVCYSDVGPDQAVFERRAPLVLGIRQNAERARRASVELTFIRNADMGGGGRPIDPLMVRDVRRGLRAQALRPKPIQTRTRDLFPAVVDGERVAAPLVAF